MKVVSIDGLAINDGVSYAAWLSSPHSQPSLAVEMAERVGAEPIVSQVTRQAATMNLTVRLAADTAAEERTLRRELLTALDTETAAVALVVSDDDGGNLRYRYVVARAVEEEDRSQGMGVMFVATLTTHGDTAWRAATPTTVGWAVTASEQTTAVVNPGDLPARPIYTVQPTADNTGGDTVWDEKRFAPVPWTSTVARENWPICLTADTPFDTAALILAGTITAETEIGVIVNGREVRRWIANYDAAETAVWVNLDFQTGASVTAELDAAMGEGETVSEVAWLEHSSGANFPATGMFLIDQEVFTYSGLDTARRRFVGVSRAAKGTVAQAHEAGARVYWIQHDVWLVYGGRTRETVFDGLPYDAYKPLLDFSISTNALWAWEAFYDATGLRAAAWRPSVGGDAFLATAIGDPAEQIEVSRPSAGAIEAGAEAAWTVPIAFPARWFELTGVRNYKNDSGVWNVTFFAGGFDAVTTIPAPTLIGESELILVDDEMSGAAGWYFDNQYYLRLTTRSGAQMYTRVDGVRVEFSGDEANLWSYPRIWLGAVVDNYSLALELRNVTSGEAIDLTVQMEVGQQLEVDTENYTVTLLDDGSNQYQALSRDARRKEILLLPAGTTTLKATEPGLAGMTITIEFEARYYT